MNKMLKFEKIWIIVVIVATITVSIILAFRFPHPFNYHEYAPDYHWFDLTLRSSFLRFSELPGLAAPLTSGIVNGHDYVYTSQNNAFQLFYLIILKSFGWLINLDNAFTFLIAARILMIIVNVLAFLSLFKLLKLIFPANGFNSKLICLLLFISWPIYSYLEVSRWMPLLIILLSWALYFSVDYLRHDNRNSLIKLIPLLFFLSFIHYFGSVFAISITLLLLFLSKHNRPVILLLITIVLAGTFAEIFSVYFYSMRYDKLGSRETGFSHILYYAKNWLSTWKTITLASFGKTEFHLNLHGTIPNMMSDITSSLVPILPEKLFKAREALGLQWSRWSTVHGNTPWYAYQLAIIGFISQLIAIVGFIGIFVGNNVFKKSKLVLGRLTNIIKRPTSSSSGQKFLFIFVIIYFILYFFVFFRIEPEPYARYGFLTVPVAIILSYLITYSSDSFKSRLTRIVLLSTYILMAFTFQVNREYIKPHMREYFNPYQRLIEWSAEHVNGRALYFDFSDYYYMPAKLLIDGPMPFGEYAFPNYNNTHIFSGVYADEKTFIVGISADMPMTKDEEIISKFKIGSKMSLMDIPTRGIGVYYLPERPTEATVNLEYFESIQLLKTQRVIYFYAGELMTQKNKQLK